jgi:ribosome maturation factor RimP
MTTINEQVKALIKPTVESMGYEFWGLIFQAQQGRSLLRVFIESPQGVPIDACEKISRQIASILDTEDVIRHAYVLEVSSPGMDRQLFELEHYRRVVGSKVKVKLLEAIEGRRSFVGIVIGVEEDGNISLNVEGKSMVLPIEKIQTAQVQPDFSKPGKPKKNL